MPWVSEQAKQNLRAAKRGVRYARMQLDTCLELELDARLAEERLREALRRLRINQQAVLEEALDG